MSIMKQSFKVGDMTCPSCEKRIEKELGRLSGMKSVKASYSDSTVKVEYEPELVAPASIRAAIEKAGYSVGGSSDPFKLLGIAVIAAAIYLLGNAHGGFAMSSRLNSGTTYAVLLVIGVLTSLHCVGMCGGILLSQSIPAGDRSPSRISSLLPALLYNAGRVVSYTVLGGIVGGVGAVLSISLPVKAGISVFAGLFMILMGLNMTGLRLFRRFSFRIPLRFCSMKAKPRGPFIVGLLNGLLPCGPLQTMQLYALGTGSAIKGALSMFVFSLGTVPLMLLFGALAGFMSRCFTKSLLKFSGVLVLLLGFVMANRGLALAGVRPVTVQNLIGDLTGTAKKADLNAATASSSKAVLQNGVQVLNMIADQNGYSPTVLYIQKGIPVKWIIQGNQINSCNGQLVIPSIGIQKNLEQGQNVIEFTPKGTSDINFSCWMGMLTGVIKVVDNLESYTAPKTETAPSSSSSMSCCSGSGTTTQNQSAGSSSIFGNNISVVPSNRLVKLVRIKNHNALIDIHGINNEVDPPIIVTSKGALSTITYHMEKFGFPVAEYTIVDMASGARLKTTKELTSVFSLSYRFTRAGSYAVLKGNQMLNAIKVVDSLKAVNVDQIRSEFIE